MPGQNSRKTTTPKHELIEQQKRHKMTDREMEKGLFLFIRDNEPAIYHDDWQSIATRVSSIDPNIKVRLFTKTHPPMAELAAFANMPTLAVVLYNHIPPLPRGRVIRNRKVSKLDQLKRYKQHGIPFPPAAVFRWGMSPDPAIYGDYVVLKPLDLEAGSLGHAELWPTAQIAELLPDSFQPSHPIRRFAYLIQKYIHTGDHPTSTRITNVCQSNVVSYVMRLRTPVDLTNNTQNQVIATNGGDRDRSIIYHDKQLQLATQAAACFPNIPIQAMDIVTDEDTQQSYILESNLGGNTWHFSSRYASKMREEMGEDARQKMLDQFDCYNTAAKALAEATRSLAQ